MSNELAQTTGGAISTQRGTMQHFSKLTEGGFNARLKLFSKGPFIDARKISPGHFGIARGEDIEADFGDRVDILPLAWRSQAEDWSNGDKPVFSYDFESPVFQEIAEKADNWHSDTGQMSPYRYGPCLLLVCRDLPGRFLEFYVTGKRARPEIGHIESFLPATQEDIDAGLSRSPSPKPADPVTLTSRLKGRRNQSHVPVVNPCSTPFSTLPFGVAEEIAKFLNAKSTEVESVTGQRAR